MRRSEAKAGRRTRAQAEALAWRAVAIGLELLVDAEENLAALVRNLDEVVRRYSRLRSAASVPSRRRHPLSRSK